MYAKCGALDKAQQVFDQLCLRNTISWNSLIAAYTQDGQGEEALRAFELMKAGGFSPDRYTFACVLKACGMEGFLEIGQEIHAQIARENLTRNDHVMGNALVVMYAKCGSLQKAQEIFDKLSFKDVVTWNGLIGCYTEHGYCEKALHCFDQMQTLGISPNAVTIAIALKACSCIGNLSKGQYIHDQFLRGHMIGTDLMVTNALLDMYAKCNALDQAREIFETMPIQTVVSWTALIVGYLENGSADEAITCFEQMQIKGVCPDMVTFSYVLKACGTVGAMEKGQEIHSQFVRNHALERDVLVANALVDMYAKCGALGKAREVFDSLPFQGVVSWNVLITGFVQQCFGELVFSMYELMLRKGVSPNEFTFACILKACSTVFALSKGLQIHAQIRIDCLQDTNIVIGTALVDMYAKCGQLIEAEKVFIELPARDVVSWNALIAGYSCNEQHINVLQSLERMEQEDIVPDDATLICGLNACSHTGNIKTGQKLHVQILRYGLSENNVIIGNALIDFYGSCFMLSEAQNMFDSLVARDIVSWNALIAGYVEHQCGEQALDCYKIMQMAGFSPDAITFACILSACSSLGFLCGGQHMHAEAAKRGLLRRGFSIDCALLAMYASCGMLTEAQIVFNSLVVWDVQSWTTLMTGYAQYGYNEAVFLLFKCMIEEGIEPDPVVLTVVVYCCSHSGLLEEALWCFESVKHCFIPTVDNHACIVDLYCRAGRLDKAVALVEIIPYLVDLILWRTLLGACHKGLAEQLGRWVFDHAVQLNDKDGSAYVCLSNIHAAASGT